MKFSNIAVVKVTNPLNSKSSRSLEIPTNPAVDVEYPILKYHLTSSSFPSFFFFSTILLKFVTTIELKSAFHERKSLLAEFLL
ncbi:hypothetical protein HNQ62_000365 [Sulfurisphaera ohwakuensis]|uniref:Uncharacterized protein n=1 Tax=Sulfurisphaera ohwakuensis TaxID=69656 RepID=A0A7J9RNR7_SULOH|nr:hypothetical protein [Sulfurisphaera ohwakuensis]